MNRTGQQWAQGTYQPVVLVKGTERVQELCQKNGLCLADLLRPFGLRVGGANAAIRIRTPAGSKLVRNYGVRIVDVDNVKTSSVKRVAADLSAVVAENQPQSDREEDGISCRADAIRFFRTHSDPTPWFTAYRTQLLRSLCFARHEFSEQPVGVIVVVSSDEPEPGKRLSKLSASSNLPKMVTDGYLDSTQLPYAYWVLRDSGAHEEGSAEQALKDVKGWFPNGHCAMITVNSRPEGEISLDTDIWSRLPGLRAPSPPLASSDAKATTEGKAEAKIEPKRKVMRRGERLTRKDREGIATQISDFVLKEVNPRLERKIAALNEQVAAQRKGIGNTLKLMFGGRKSTRTGRIREGGYDIKSIESKIRQVADLSLLVTDYEAALSHYRTVKSDYQHDKLTRLLASANEMQGLCALLTQGPRSNADHYIDNAVGWYVANNEPARAMRATLWLVDALRTHGHHAAAALRLKKASEREARAAGGASVGAAMLMEQAAYSFARDRNVQIRKYAFHLVMAGHLYHKAQQHLHGVRCYRSARAVYRERRWFHIEDHIDFDLARNLSRLRDREKSLEFFSTLLDFETDPNPFTTGLRRAKDIDQNSPADEKTYLESAVPIVRRPRIGTQQQQAPDRQAAYVRELLAVVSDLGSGSDAPVPIRNLKLPVIVDSRVAVILKVHNTIPSDVAASAWAACILTSAPRTNHLDILEKPLLDLVKIRQKAKQTQRRCYVGEPVTVALTVQNPLHTPLRVSRMRLNCMLNVDGKKVSSSKNAELEDDVFAMSEAQLNMTPRSSMEIFLSVKPKQEGLLTISGVRWVAGDNMLCVHDFRLLPERMIKTTHTGRKRAIVSANRALEVPVVAAAPQLRFEIANLPSTMRHNEVVRCTFAVSNAGARGVDAGQTQIKISHPGFCVLVPPGGKALSYDPRTQLVTLPCAFAPGERVEFDLWVRATLVAQHTLGFLVRYAYSEAKSDGADGQDSKGEAQGKKGTPPPKSLFRVAYVSKRLRVLPGLQVSVQCRPSIRFADQDTSLLMLLLKNRELVRTDGKTSPGTRPGGAAVGALRVRGAMVVSRAFAIRRFDSGSVATLGPQETHNLVLRVHRRPRDDEDASGSSAASAQYGSASCGVSSVSFNKDGKEDQVPMAVWKLLGMDAELDRLELKRKKMMNPNAYRGVDPDKVDAKVFDLLIRWTCDPDPSDAGKATTEGYHLIRNQTCLRALYTQTGGACPLKVMVHHPQNVVHDFGQGRVVVPVTIRVRNRRDDEPVTFVLETLPPTQRFDPVSRSFREDANRSMHGRYCWQGTTTQRIANLAPSARVDLSLGAVFHAPGKHNLNRFRFSVEMPGMGIKHFFFPLQHLVAVEQAPEEAGSAPSSEP